MYNKIIVIVLLSIENYHANYHGNIYVISHLFYFVAYVQTVLDCRVNKICHGWMHRWTNNMKTMPLPSCGQRHRNSLAFCVN